MKALVTAASKHGATAGIAAAIADGLARRGVTPMLITDPDDVSDLEGVDAVVLGSAVYAGRWHKPAVALVDRLAGQMAVLPVWLFSSGPVGNPPRPAEDPTDIADLLNRTGARGHRVFAGCIDRRRLGLAERAIVRALHVPDGDFRDWEAIDAWAAEIAAALRTGARTV